MKSVSINRRTLKIVFGNHYKEFTYQIPPKTRSSEFITNVLFDVSKKICFDKISFQACYTKIWEQLLFKNLYFLGEKRAIANEFDRIRENEKIREIYM